MQKQKPSVQEQTPAKLPISPKSGVIARPPLASQSPIARSNGTIALSSLPELQGFIFGSKSVPSTSKNQASLNFVPLQAANLNSASILSPRPAFSELQSFATRQNLSPPLRFSLNKMAQGAQISADICPIKPIAQSSLLQHLADAGAKAFICRGIISTDSSKLAQAAMATSSKNLRKFTTEQGTEIFVAKSNAKEFVKINKRLEKITAQLPDGIQSLSADAPQNIREISDEMNALTRRRSLLVVLEIIPKQRIIQKMKISNEKKELPTANDKLQGSPTPAPISSKRPKSKLASKLRRAIAFGGKSISSLAFAFAVLSSISNFANTSAVLSSEGKVLSANAKHIRGKKPLMSKQLSSSSSGDNGNPNSDEPTPSLNPRNFFFVDGASAGEEHGFVRDVLPGEYGQSVQIGDNRYLELHPVPIDVGGIKSHIWISGNSVNDRFYCLSPEAKIGNDTRGIPLSQDSSIVGIFTVVGGTMRFYPFYGPSAPQIAATFSLSWNSPSTESISAERIRGTFFMKISHKGRRGVYYYDVRRHSLYFDESSGGRIENIATTLGESPYYAHLSYSSLMRQDQTRGKHNFRVPELWQDRNLARQSRIKTDEIPEKSSKEDVVVSETQQRPVSAHN